MSAEDIITAYKHVAVPEKQEQNLPGLDKNIEPGLEYTKQEVWDDEGKPVLREYVGSGKLKGKTAIVTGGDSGIGRSAAMLFAREGAAGITIVHLTEEKEDAEAVKLALEKDGAKCLLVPCNLEKEKDCQAVVDAHVQTFGSLHVLVNNASKQILASKLEDIDLENVRSTFQSNILQMFAVTKFALPHMKRGSSIINTTSVTAYKGSGSLVDYSSTKGAIVTFTRSLATQLAPKGIRVNAIAPGPVITSLQAASRPADQMEGLGVGMPLHGRAAQPAEMGPAYVFLASPSDSNCMTGAVLHINNGQHIGGS
ncbi:NAD(P)-binding protein [Heliocybe sulcata]|uniref:NAD(P)-binding protein n=1 Tax=Heliocybe sulcata TaxID=5364 RepID=A0A5C3N1E1_9AGAM|nr:NAD(P)-binding protein [Heliocybe sulcata]